jgi:hypothetical protein
MAGGGASTIDMMDWPACVERERAVMVEARFPPPGADLADLERVTVVVVGAVVCARPAAEAGRGRGVTVDAFDAAAALGEKCAAADAGRARGVVAPEPRFADADDCDRFIGTFPTSAAFQPA